MSGIGGTAIGIRFLAGQYHATPWDAHVNEAAVEWPPSLWRLLRGLIAVWHRKFVDAIPEAAVRDLVETLARESPSYRLPSASAAHTRQYMPTAASTTLVFDGFLRIDCGDELIVAWPTLELDDERRRTLSILLSGLGYLGRAESWVEARLLDQWDGKLNCQPLEDGVVATGEEIRLPVPQGPSEYAEWRSREIAARGLDHRRLNASQRRLLATLPENLFDALSLDTGTVRAQRWNRPPGMNDARYARGVSRPARTVRHASLHENVTTVRLALAGKPLPRLEDAIKIGEVVRHALIRRADELTSEDGDVPPVITGHQMGHVNGHRHAFYMPGDADDDGHIDHVIVHAEAGLDDTTLSALARLERIWLDEGNEWAVILDSFGSARDFATHRYLGTGTTWVSATPYLHPWHRKKSLSIEDQIRRECRARGLAEPKVERRAAVRVKGRDRRPVHFHRFRSRGGRKRVQPDTQGSFWKLTFPEPVPGPVALGTHCHFGLGIFRRASSVTLPGSSTT